MKYIVVMGIIHGGVQEHEHDVTLELGSGANCSIFNILLNFLQVHGSVNNGMMRKEVQCSETKRKKYIQCKWISEMIMDIKISLE